MKYDDFGVVVAAGGSSRRFGEQNKLLADLDGAALFTHPLTVFAQICPLKNIVLVASAAEQAEFRSEMSQIDEIKEIPLEVGGVNRMTSILNGLRALPASLDYVAVHDAARPLITVDFVENCLRFARSNGSAVAAKTVTDTIKKTTKDDRVLDTIDRERVAAVETPQIFKFELLKRAYDQACRQGRLFTDDAGVMTHAGHDVFLFKHDKPNIKVTYPTDLDLARFLIRRK